MPLSSSFSPFFFSIFSRLPQHTHTHTRHQESCCLGGCMVFSLLVFYLPKSCSLCPFSSSSFRVYACMCAPLICTRECVIDRFYARVVHTETKASASPTCFVFLLRAGDTVVMEYLLYNVWREYVNHYFFEG